MHNFHPFHHGHFVHELIGWWQRYRERDWLVSTEQAILSTWLIKSSSAKLMFGEHSYGTNIFTFFCALKEAYPHTSSPDLLVTNFSIMFFLGPHHQAKSLATDHELLYNHRFGYFFQAKWTSRCTDQSYAHWEDFSSLLPFRNVPERVCSAVVDYRLCWHIVRNNLLIMPEFSLPLFGNWLLETPHEAIGVLWEKGSSVARVWTMDIWATSLCNSFVPSGPASAWSQLYHFHLMMEWLFVHATLWFVCSDNTQFMKGSSDCMVTWWSMVKHSVSTRAQ